jgi:Tfp pilus assembly protein PilF
MRQLRVEAETTVPAAPSTRADRLRLGLAWMRWLRPRSKAGASTVSPRALSSHGAALGLLGRLATAPQVAMGTVMLLIVLVGLWSLPQLTRRGASRFGASLQSERVHRPRPDTDVSAASAGLQNQVPAPAQLEHPADPRQHLGRRAQPSAAAKAALPKSDLELAMQHYRAREYALATPLFSRALISASASHDQTTALLYLARAERALGHCDRAVNSYDTLVHIHPGKIEARAALREAVVCYTKLGEPQRAHRLLEHAAATPQLESSARNIASQYPAFATLKTPPSDRSRATVRSD